MFALPTPQTSMLPILPAIIGSSATLVARWHSDGASWRSTGRRGSSCSDGRGRGARGPSSTRTSTRSPRRRRSRRRRRARGSPGAASRGRSHVPRRARRDGPLLAHLLYVGVPPMTEAANPLQLKETFVIAVLSADVCFRSPGSYLSCCAGSSPRRQRPPPGARRRRVPERGAPGHELRRLEVGPSAALPQHHLPARAAPCVQGTSGRRGSPSLASSRRSTEAGRRVELSIFSDAPTRARGFADTPSTAAVPR